MGILSSLFGKKKETESKSVVTTKSLQTEHKASPLILHPRGKPDSDGLYPSELVMLAVAEKYKTKETSFPSYLTTIYEVANPAKTLKNLEARGFIETGSSKEALSQMKVAELKEIAHALEITPKGKKNDIINQLSIVPDEQLDVLVQDRYWRLTFDGQAALAANPYVQYFLDNHPYNVTEVGVTIWTVNDDFSLNPKQPFRDIIFRQINKKQLEASAALYADPSSGSYNAQIYCECSRLMALFVEEEGKSYTNAADLYFRYLFSRINIYGGLELISRYKLIGKYSPIDQITSVFYGDVRLYPVHRNELSRLIDELSLTGDDLRSLMLTSFKRAGDTGVMTEDEAADFIILELSGENEKGKELAEKIARKALKKVKLNR